jgi:hypothetical protein
MLPSVVRIFHNATGTRRTTPLLSLPTCRCVQHRHPERPTGVEGSLSSFCSTQPPPITISNRESGIRNPNNHPISNHFHFSNRKYSAIFLKHRATNVQPPHSNRYTAIRNPINPPHFNHFQFYNRYKSHLLRPKRTSGNACFRASPPSRFSLPESPCLRASVANLCDNGWLQLRLM